MRFRASVFIICLGASAVTFAKTGTSIVTGRVTESGTLVPVIGARVRLLTGGAVVTGGYTNGAGAFTVRKVPDGTYTVIVSSIGYREGHRDSVAITENTTIDFTLDPVATHLDEVVVTASRKEEKVIDAPASISVVSAAEITVQPAQTVLDHVATVPGVDVAHSAMMQQDITVRGFNSTFSNVALVLTDNRIAAIPALGGNVSSLIPAIDDDIERIEVVRGPGAALYGPNASSGVVNIITRSPFASQGTSISIAGGSRSMMEGTIRHAGLITDKIAYKVSGLYFRADEWQYADSSEVAARDTAIAHGAKPDTLRIGNRLPNAERFGAEARIDADLGGDALLNATAGFTQNVATTVLTPISAAQFRNWRYIYYQGRFTLHDLLVQAYLNVDNSGESYFLRNGNSTVDKSTEFVAQAQHAWRFGDWERFTYGADLLMTNPVTDGTIDGVNENNDKVTEFGVYAQSESKLVEHALDLVLAGRLDKHSEFDAPIVSPRAALLWTPWDGQTLRLTYNSAFTNPSPGQLFNDIIAAANPFGFPPGSEIAFRVMAAPKDGYTFQRDANGRPYFHTPFGDHATAIPVDEAATLWPAILGTLRSLGIHYADSIPSPTAAQVRAAMALFNGASFTPVNGPVDIPHLRPTITQTYEFGYKGTLFDKVQLGVDVYHSRVHDFVGQTQFITPNVFLNAADVSAYVEPFIKASLLKQGMSDSAASSAAAQQAATVSAAASGVPLGTVTPIQAKDPLAVLLAARSYGSVDLNGVDVSVDVDVTRRWTIGAGYSYVDQNYFPNLDNQSDLALNAPMHKGSARVRYRDAEHGFDAEVRMRSCGGFKENSGVYIGDIAAYTLFDLTASYAIPGIAGLTVTASGTNLFDVKHQEFLGAPFLGRLMFVRLGWRM